MIDLFVAERGITEVVHFTHQRALLGMSFTRALLPRDQLREEQILEYILKFNAEERRDQPWFDHVNLSIEDVNRRFLRSSMRRHPTLWWCILAFDPSMLEHDGVHFATTNNMYEWTVARETGIAGLRSLYGDVRHGGQWVTHAASAGPIPSCPQAEVLYPGRLSMDYLRRVYVQTNDNSREASSYLTFLRRDVEVVVAPERFSAATKDPCQTST